jgi:trk system potassium uptake protein TrkA
VLSKAVTQRQREILLRVGADQVVLPEVDGGRRLAGELVAPAVLERLQLGPDHSIAELHVPSSLAGQTLAQLDLRSRMGVTVLVIKGAERMVVSPPAEAVLLEGDLLVVLGSNDDLQRFYELP